MVDKKAIVFFDGYCHLCNGAVLFIIQRDSGNYFSFAPLQGITAQTELPAKFEKEDLPDSLILLENGNIYIESTAAFKIAGKLRFPWNLLYMFIIVPKFLRDLAYRFIATRRYQWFGKRDSCSIPGAGWKDRFLE
ncbi:MAG: DUF393 domain-containing protein [Cyclobacteriaceae bacterium]|nr:DUF393 domain-containing protein [Cyclobacteriaceae bacterium]